MKLLAAADLHLGRALGQVGADWARAYSPRQAWRELAERAVSEGVDALLLAGDVVDQSQLFFEAYGALHSGIRKLADNGIRVIAVAGNHDTVVLPELAQTLDPGDFCLLGRGGRWEWCDIRDGRGRCVRVYGWSFPGEHHGTSPIPGAIDLGEDAPATKVGLLHADLGKTESRYNPLLLGDLERTGIPLWILGHTHVPSCSEGNGVQAHYPGSLQGLHPDETGPHGALLIDYPVPGQPATVTPVPIARLTYLRIQLDAAGLGCSRPELVNALRQHIREQLGEGEVTGRALSIDLHIAGESRHGRRDFDAVLLDGGLSGEGVEIGGFLCRLRTCTYDLRPELDIGELAAAGGRDLLSVLAQLLLDLESGKGGEGLAGKAIAQAERAIAAAASSGAFQRLDDPVQDTPAAAPDARELLLRQGYELLRELHRQRERSHA
ncbi:MAG: DNA repair exonuclease [Lentisphaeria bacterium]|nr:DNA repair exonuclease [Lentisphaeria bacterium]